MPETTTTVLVVEDEESFIDALTVGLDVGPHRRACRQHRQGTERKS